MNGSTENRQVTSSRHPTGNALILRTQLTAAARAARACSSTWTPKAGEVVAVRTTISSVHDTAPAVSAAA